MKIHPPALGICTLILFSCSKNDKKEEAVLKNSDTIAGTPPEKDHTPVEEIKEQAKNGNLPLNHRIQRDSRNNRG